MPLELALDVQRCLAAGWGKRTVARELAVSIDSVRAIAGGTWPGFKRFPLLIQHRALPQESPSGAFQRPIMPRCPACGHKVFLPCQICKARAALAKSKARGLRRNGHAEVGTIELELFGEERKRYEVLHRRKLRTGELPMWIGPAEPVFHEDDDNEPSEPLDERLIEQALGPE